MATLTTPRLGLPYPDGAERVMDGDNAIGALANAVDGPLGAQVYPLSCVVAGAAALSVGVATDTKLPLDTFVSGNAAMFNDSLDRVIIPTGGDGLYLALASCQVTNLAVGKAVRLRFAVGGSAQNDGTTVPGTAGSAAFCQIFGIYNLAAAQYIEVNGLGDATDPADFFVRRLWVMRIASGYGASVLEALGDALARPAPE